MNQNLVTITIVAAVFVRMLLQGQGGFRSLFSQANGYVHTHCWKQKLYVYTQPEVLENAILCHRGGAEENK
jgi:hypothetical protein